MHYFGKYNYTECEAQKEIENIYAAGDDCLENEEEILNNPPAFKFIPTSENFMKGLIL